MRVTYGDGSDSCYRLKAEIRPTLRLKPPAVVVNPSPLQEVCQHLSHPALVKGGSVTFGLSWTYGRLARKACHLANVRFIRQLIRMYGLALERASTGAG